MPYKDPTVKRLKAREYCRKWRVNNLEKMRESQRRTYYKRKSAGLRDSTPERRAEYMRSYRKKNRPKMTAYETVKRAVKQGKLVKPEHCQQCGNNASRIEAHHYLGYAKEHRLTVEWLCVSCHSLHRRNGPYVPKPERRIQG